MRLFETVTLPVNVHGQERTSPPMSYQSGAFPETVEEAYEEKSCTKKMNCKIQNSSRNSDLFINFVFSPSPNDCHLLKREVPLLTVISDSSITKG